MLSGRPPQCTCSVHTVSLWLHTVSQNSQTKPQLYNPESYFHLRSLVAAALELVMIYCCTKYMLQQIHQSYFSNTDPSSWFDVEVWLSCCRRVKGAFFVFLLHAGLIYLGNIMKGFCFGLQCCSDKIPRDSDSLSIICQWLLIWHKFLGV